MITLSRTLGAITMAALLSACGGGGGGGPRTEFNYQPFDSRVAGQSRIAAVGLVQDEGSGIPTSTRSVLGTLDRGQTSTLSINGVIVNGVEVSEQVWSDGNGNRVDLNNTLFRELDLQFSIPVDVSFASGLSGQHMVGVVSRSEDLPNGSAVYFGAADIDAILRPTIDSEEQFMNSSGSLTLTARFGTDHVDATITGLVGMPFTSIELRNLEISSGSDALFGWDAGSTIVFLNDGGTVTPLIGSDPNYAASGAFFGGDGNGPVEAGGVFAVDGEDGNIWGIFSANNRR